MGLGGIEPPTSPLSGVRSSHLSYRPVGQWPCARGFQPCRYSPSSPRHSSASASPRLSQGTLEIRRATGAFHWWSWSGSNRRPPECKSGALPAELQPLKCREPGAAANQPDLPVLRRARLLISDVLNRGQLDAETKESSPSSLKTLPYAPSGDCGYGLTVQAEARTVVWSGTAVFYLLDAVHSSSSFKNSTHVLS